MMLDPTLLTGRSPRSKLKPITLMLGDQIISIALVRRQNAKRLILRHDPSTGQFSLSLPPASSRSDAKRFVLAEQTWMARQISNMPSPLGQGDEIPYLGKGRRLHFSGSGRRCVLLGHDSLTVMGPLEGAEARAIRWFCEAARTVLTPMARDFASAVGQPLTSVAIGDMKSRWGSCSSRGGIRFSWRVVMAPDFVGRYLAAHECAHLVHMNHSKQFWSLVAELDPGHGRARRWLKQHGPQLMAVRLAADCSASGD